MCGIAGYFEPESKDPNYLRAMCDAIVHRGPDDDGYFRQGSVGLGIRRLAIIDLVTGAQPVFNEDRSIAVVFNGEIYNFHELRAGLEKKGHLFATSTDTECIVHLYEDHGERCVEFLRGMFAIALWDSNNERLLLARDRAGKKPLFYRETAQGIHFASEPKALIQDPGFAREVDPIALHHYLTYQYVPAPLSIYKSVKKLPPAHTLVFENGKAATRRYWHLDYSKKSSIDESEASERLTDLLKEATALRLISDRPLGAFLSGGIDSSAVVACMAMSQSGLVKTFSIGFEDERFDERRFARMVANRYATDHHELVVRPDAAEILEKLVWHYDEPFADSSSIPSYYVAKIAREHVVVALNGDGGDESFAGYDRYLAMKLAQAARIPTSLRGSLAKLVQALPASRARRAAGILLDPPDVRYGRLMSYFTPEQKDSIYSSEMRSLTSGVDSYDILRHEMKDHGADHLTDVLLGTDVGTYLPGDLLVKMDIASMANSLEARSPFLDHKVMEFAASLPADLKIRGRTKKYILKKATASLLPAEILDRPKMGFGVPIANWLRHDLKELLRDSLLDTTARSRGYFEPAAVENLITEHGGGRDHSTRLWALLQFEMWHRMFIDRNATVSP